MKRGTVYLIGAGPGDTGLLTQKGIECLSHADVVVYDRLLDTQLLDLVPPEAEKIYVGKSPSRHTMNQSEINRLLIEKATEGKAVVRLKGGDPFVLGRGAEEAKILAVNHIPFQIVPGISSAIAVPAYAGIPVTCRKKSSSFAVITGHEAAGKKGTTVKWDKLATGVDTLVILMGMKNLESIVVDLIKHGRPPHTPVAIIKEGTRAGQRTVTGSLENIVAKVKKYKLSSPAVIVVGEVVTLRKTLRWFDKLPLFGKRILVTRSRHQASALSRLLSELGAEPVELPVIDIQPVEDTEEIDRAIMDLDRYHWLVFTSSNGVEAFFGRLRSLKLDSRHLHGTRIAVIGPATAGALEQQGIAPDYCPPVYTASGLLDGFASMNIERQNFLLPRADIADKELSEGIRRIGGSVKEIAVYRTVVPKDNNSPESTGRLPGGIDVITFTSSSTVSNFIALFGKNAISSETRIACIGPKTEETALKAGLSVDITAGEHTIPGLAAAIEEHFRKEV